MTVAKDGSGDCKTIEEAVGKISKKSKTRFVIHVKAEKLVEAAMKGNDASHDAAHVFRVRDMVVSLALEEGLSFCFDSMEIVELAALLHDIGDYKYVRLVFLLLNNLKFLSLL